MEPRYLNGYFITIMNKNSDVKSITQQYTNKRQKGVLEKTEDK